MGRSVHLIKSEKVFEVLVLFGSILVLPILNARIILSKIGVFVFNL